MKVAVLIASFNRVDTTLRALESLFAAERQQDIAELVVYLLDDASPDQTGAIVKRRFPAVNVLHGTGNLFWNRGMCRAYDAARRSGIAFDAYLLFNDDVVLMPNALDKMLSAYSELNLTAPAVISCPMKSRQTDEVTYFGFCQRPNQRNPLHLAKVLPDGTIRECDTFHGNCVLIPAREMDAVGGLDRGFHHLHGDTDLGLRLRERGCNTYLLTEPFGFCERDPEPAGNPSLRRRVSSLFFPPKSYFDEIRPALKRLRWESAIRFAIIHLRDRLRSAMRQPP